MADFAPELIFFNKNTSKATEKEQTFQSYFPQLQRNQQDIASLWSNPHDKINEVELNHSQDRLYGGGITNN